MSSGGHPCILVHLVIAKKLNTAKIFAVVIRIVSFEAQLNPFLSKVSV